MFGLITTKAMIAGAAGLGIAALIAWLFRRQIINLVWIKKLTNNGKKLGKQIDKWLIPALQKQMEVKDELIKKKSIYEKKKEKAIKLKKADLEQRIDSLIGGIDKELEKWETKLAEELEQGIDQIIKGKTDELNTRIDGLDSIKDGAKVGLKNLWAGMVLSIKTVGYAEFAQTKIITADNILKDIDKKLDEESANVEKQQGEMKVKLKELYKNQAPIKVGTDPEIKVVLGDYYTFYKIPDPSKKKKDQDAKTKYIDNTFAQFNLDETEMIEGKAKVVPRLVVIKLDKETDLGIIEEKGVYTDEAEINQITQKIEDYTGTPNNAHFSERQLRIRLRAAQSDEGKKREAEIAKQIQEAIEQKKIDEDKRKELEALKAEEERVENAKQEARVKTKVLKWLKDSGIKSAFIPATRILSRLI